MGIKSFNTLFLFFVPFLILTFLVWLMNSDFYVTSPNSLIHAITLDFLITIPFVYFLIIRNKNIPKITVLTVFVVCMMLASFLIPEQHQSFLQLLKTIVIPIIEIGLVTLIGYKGYYIYKNHKAQPNKELDFYDVINISCEEVVPGRIGKLLATEIAVIYYAFFASRKKKLQQNEFTYFKKSSIKSSVWVLIGLVVVETGIVHLLLVNPYATLAWVLTFISIYTIVQIFSLMRSMDRRPIIIDHELKVLKLRYGFFTQVDIPFEFIESYEWTGRSPPKEKHSIYLSALDILDTTNIILTLNKKLQLTKLYGMTKEFRKISFYIDEKEDFNEMLKQVVD